MVISRFFSFILAVLLVAGPACGGQDSDAGTDRARGFEVQAGQACIQLPLLNPR